MKEMTEKIAIQLTWGELYDLAKEQMSNFVDPSYAIEVRKGQNGFRIGLETGSFDEEDLDQIYASIGADYVDVTTTERRTDMLDQLSESLSLKIILPAIPLAVETVYSGKDGACFVGTKKE